MKKLIITGAQGTGKSTFAKELSEGKKAIIVRPGDDQTSFFSRVQNENFDFVILEEANAFDSDFIDLILFHDHVLTQNENATLIAIFQGIPIWAWKFPIYKTECSSYINKSPFNIDEKQAKKQCTAFLEETILSKKCIAGHDYDILPSTEIVIGNGISQKTIIIDGKYILYIPTFHLSQLGKQVPLIGTIRCHRFKSINKETHEENIRISSAFVFNLEQLILLSGLNLNIKEIIDL